MRSTNSTARLSVAIAAVVAIVACSDRAERQSEAAARDAGRAAEHAGSAVAEAAKDVGAAARDTARATGEAVMNGGKAADAAIETMDVKMALSADARIDADDINVDSDHVTKTVTLKGSVPTLEQKGLAEAVAKARATGYVVQNQLVVRAR